MRRRSARRSVTRLVLLALVAGALFPRATLATWPRNARVLILSAFPTEGAKILAAAGPVTDGRVVNRPGVFPRTHAGKNVVTGLDRLRLVDARPDARAAAG